MFKEKIGNAFVKNKIIGSDDSMILFYGMKILLLKLIHILIFMIVGALFNRLLLTTALYFILFALRSYTGGFHAKSPLLCLVYSLIISILFNMYCEAISSSLLILLITTWIAHRIQLNSPIVYEDNPLSLNEINFFRERITIILAITISILGIGTLINNIPLIAIGSYPIYIDYLLIQIFVKSSQTQKNYTIHEFNLEED